MGQRSIQRLKYCTTVSTRVCCSITCKTLPSPTAQTRGWMAGTSTHTHTHIFVVDSDVSPQASLIPAYSHISFQMASRALGRSRVPTYAYELHPRGRNPCQLSRAPNSMHARVHLQNSCIRSQTNIVGSKANVLILPIGIAYWSAQIQIHKYTSEFARMYISQNIYTGICHVPIYLGT